MSKIADKNRKFLFNYSYLFWRLLFIYIYIYTSLFIRNYMDVTKSDHSFVFC